MTIAERQVPCPACRQPALYSERNPYRPFCSARCRGVDLVAWATESYRVPVKVSADVDGRRPEATPRH
jgi:endogenous inhibitor of DNA gyrase (YacG/DUF329 family)